MRTVVASLTMAAATIPGSLRAGSGAESKFESDSIHPFHINVPKAALTDIAHAHTGNEMAHARTRDGCLARRATRHNAKAGALLGERLRLA